MTEQVSLQACTSEDATTLAVIAAATLLEAFAGFIPGSALLAHCRKYHHPAAYTAFFEQPETRAWLAVVGPGAAPVGYALLTRPEFPAELVREGDLELRRIYLFSRFHGGGAGQRMVEAAISEAREQGAGRLLLGVHPGNVRALVFYKRNGFERIGGRTFHVGAETFEDPVLARRL